MQRRDFLLAASASSLVSPTLGSTLAGRARPRSAAGFDPARLQALLDEAAKALGVVGAQLAVFDGRQVHQVATGFANRERGLAVTPDTVFQIGSTTKVFNAALVMSMVDAGLLDLDTPVKRYLPEFRLADAAATERVTLRHLLSMSSGVDNGPYQSHGRGDDALPRYVASLAEIPHLFEPGAAFGYSNAGSNIAGLVASRVAGKNWETLLAERVLRPLGATQAANFPEDLLFHPVSLGYSYRDGSTEPSRVRVWGLPRSMAPAGGTLCTSAGDLVTLARMFLGNGQSPDGTRVLSEASVRAMHTPQITMPARVTAQKWGLGPYWKQWGGHTIHGHSGTNSGGSSMLLWVPAKNVAIATIANVPNQGYPLADRIFNTVFPEMFGIAKPKTPTAGTVTPVPVKLDRYLGRFEAYGSRLEFTAESGKLMARVFSTSAPNQMLPTMTSELISLGEDRFLPADPAMGGNRGWDVAFWGTDASGRATQFLNGVFATRRTG